MRTDVQSQCSSQSSDSSNFPVHLDHFRRNNSSIQLPAALLTDLLITTLAVDELVATAPESLCDNTSTSTLDSCVCIFTYDTALLSNRIITRRIVTDASTNECMRFLQTRGSLGPVGVRPACVDDMGPWYPILADPIALVICNRGCGPEGCYGGCCESYIDKQRGRDPDVGWNSDTAQIIDPFVAASVDTSASAWYGALANNVLVSSLSDVRLQVSTYSVQTALRFGNSRAMLAALNNASLAARSSGSNLRRNKSVVARCMFKLFRAYESELCDAAGTSVRRVHTVAGDPTKFNALVETLLKHIFSNVSVSEAMAFRLADGEVSLVTNSSAAFVSGPKGLENRQVRALSSALVFKSVVTAVESTVSQRFDAVALVKNAVSMEIQSMEQKDVSWKKTLALLVDTTTLGEDPEEIKSEIAHRNTKLKELHAEFIVHLRECLKNCRTKISIPWKSFATHAKGLLMMGVLFDFCPATALIESASERIIQSATAVSEASVRIHRMDDAQELAKSFFAVPRNGAGSSFNESAQR